MALNSMENRLLALEREVARLKQQLRNDKRPWWEKVWGTFANDPAFEKAMQYGRDYRESLRPKPLKKRKRKSTSSNGHSRH